MPHPDRATPFLQRSSRTKRDAYIGVKNRIRQAAPVFGGAFVTHHYLHGENGWADVLFLGRHAPVYYNAALATTRFGYKEQVINQAFEASYVLAVERDPWILDGSVWDAGRQAWVTEKREPVQYPELGGLTRMQWVDREIPRIADSGSVTVRERWSIQRDCPRGVGVHATIDAPSLTREVIEHFIHRFLRSERNYTDPIPRTYRYGDFAHWKEECNLILEPNEWATVDAERRAALSVGDVGQGGV